MARNGEIEAVLLSRQNAMLYGVKTGSNLKAENLPKAYDFVITLRTRRCCTTI
jgi:hypothetical protein